MLDFFKNEQAAQRSHRKQRRARWRKSPWYLPWMICLGLVLFIWGVAIIFAAVAVTKIYGIANGGYFPQAARWPFGFAWKLFLVSAIPGAAWGILDKQRRKITRPWD